MSGILKAAFSGVMGIVLIVAAFLLLCFNASSGARPAGEHPSALGSVTEVGTDKIAPGNEGRLVHFTGSAETDQKLEDPEFGVAVRAIRLTRLVEMYQWTENVEEEMVDGREVETTNYRLDWSTSTHDGSSFTQPEGHSNPPMPIETFTAQAADVHVGAFRLNPNLIHTIWDDKPLEVKREDLPEKWASRLAATADGFYLPAAQKDEAGEPAVPETPQLGDVRIRFRVVESGQPVSVVAEQSGDTLKPWTAGEYPVNLLSMNSRSAKQMLPQEETAAESTNWSILLIGELLMFCGVLLSLQALNSSGEGMPALGSRRALRAMAVALLASLGLVLIAVSIMQPADGVPLLVVAGVLLVSAVAAAFLGGAKLRGGSPAVEQHSGT